jgi:hypothetical protein
VSYAKMTTKILGDFKISIQEDVLIKTGLNLENFPNLAPVFDV